MAVKVTNAFIGTPPIDFGVFYRGPLGVKLPTSAREKLDPRLEDHGAVGEDGITVAQDRSTQDIKMYGGDVFVAVQDNYSETVTVTLLEDDNDAVIKTAFGDANVVKTEATDSDGTKRVIYHTSDPLPISSFVIRSMSGDKMKTYVIERGQVASVGETKDVHTDVTRKTLTIKAYKPESPELRGGNVVEYRDDGVTINGTGPTPPAPAPSTSVRKKVTLPAGVTGGTWTLTVGNQTVDDLNFNVLATTIKSKLEALTGITDAAVSGDSVNGFTIGVTGADSITADGSGLTGGASTTIEIVDP